MIKLFRILLISKILSPKGFIYFIKSVYVSGLNLSTLLFYSANFSPNKKALHYNGTAFTYKQLLDEVILCSQFIRSNRTNNTIQRIAIHCRNNEQLIINLMAASRLGYDVYLLNTELSLEQLEHLQNQNKFDLLIYDAHYYDKFKNSIQFNTAIYSDEYQSFKSKQKRIKIKRAFGGKLIVLTGGTTGNAKSATRKTASIGFMYPLNALLQKIKLHQYRSVLIAIPAFHGFGLASIIVSIFLKKEIYFLEKFETESASKLIMNHQIEVITVVPTQLQRLYQNDSNDIRSLKVIITGGASISPLLVNETFNKLGNVLFNLYGTSEAGFCLMATPSDLVLSSDTIGKPINGVSVVLKELKSGEVIKTKNTIGKIYLKSGWSITSSNSLLDTGDLWYFDHNNSYILKGRTDDMIF
jgi:fatty-acyl-CoA synthase